MQQGWIVDGYLVQEVRVKLWDTSTPNRSLYQAQDGTNRLFVIGESIFVDRNEALHHAIDQVQEKLRELKAGKALLEAQLRGVSREDDAS